MQGATAVGQSPYLAAKKVEEHGVRLGRRHGRPSTNFVTTRTHRARAVLSQLAWFISVRAISVEHHAQPAFVPGELGGVSGAVAVQLPGDHVAHHLPLQDFDQLGGNFGAG